MADAHFFDGLFGGGFWWIFIIIIFFLFIGRGI